MSESIVLISNQRIKEGMLDGYMQTYRREIELIKADKPGTVAHLAYVNENGSEVSMIHVFPDAEALDLHMQGVGERAKKAFEFMEVISYEIYGRPSDSVLKQMQQFAGPGIELNLKLQNMGGYLRLKSG